MSTVLPRYPECEVQLSGTDANAFAILAKMTTGLRKYLTDEDISREAVDIILEEFKAEAMSGDYDHLLQTCMMWVNVQ